VEFKELRLKITADTPGVATIKASMQELKGLKQSIVELENASLTASKKELPTYEARIQAEKKLVHEKLSGLAKEHQSLQLTRTLLQANKVLYDSMSGGLVSSKAPIPQDTKVRPEKQPVTEKYIWEADKSIGDYNAQRNAQ